MKRSALLPLFFFFLCLLGCTQSIEQPIEGPQAEEVSIKKGKHYSNISQLAANMDFRVLWDVTFDSNCAYSFDDEDQLDWNKLMGFTYNGINNHNYSVRWVWRWNREEELMEVCPYIYEAGVRRAVEDKIRRVPLEMENVYEISREGENTLVFFLNHQVIYRFETVITNTGIMQYPYFGGNKTAPHDMNIYIMRH